MAFRVRRGPDSSSDHQVVFLHVPKCGGTSLAEAMTAGVRARHGSAGAVFQLDPVASKQAADMSGTGLREMREALLVYHLASDGCRFAVGHFWFSPAAAQTWPQWQWVTLLRHPVDRWLSQYFYNRDKQSEHFRVQDQLELFLESERAHAMGSHYVSKLADAGHDQRAREEQAVSRLSSFALVGTLEELPAFVQAYGDLYGHKLEVPHRNPNPTSLAEQRAELRPALVAAIEEVCAPDLRVYEAAQELIRA